MVHWPTAVEVVESGTATVSWSKSSLVLQLIIRLLDILYSPD